MRFKVFMHGHDMTPMITCLGAKCLPTKYGGLMNIETDQGVELWNLLCHYEGNYKGIVNEQ